MKTLWRPGDKVIFAGTPREVLEPRDDLVVHACQTLAEWEEDCGISRHTYIWTGPIDVRDEREGIYGAYPDSIRRLHWSNPRWRS